MFVHFEVWEWVAAICVIVANTFWQIVMGMVPASSVPYFGGDGFSYTNLVYATGGTVLAMLVDVAMPPHWKPLHSDSM